MTLMESIRICFIKYFDFSGRATRREFWFFNLFCIFVSYMYDFLFVSDADLTNPEITLSVWISFLISFSLIIPLLAVGARRLHDINKSGWLQLLMITVIGAIPLIVLLLMEGKNESNQYGEPVKSD